MSEDKACAVPLIERLRKVPKHARHAEDWPASKGLGTSYYPTGALCHEAADALAQHQTERDSGAAPDERAAFAELTEKIRRLDHYGNPHYGFVLEADVLAVIASMQQPDSGRSE
jgi:hypothetical protein